ncbi:hypothetical protein D3C81_1914790 [compost metagenome]
MSSSADQQTQIRTSYLQNSRFLGMNDFHFHLEPHALGNIHNEMNGLLVSFLHRLSGILARYTAGSLLFALSC